MNLKIDLIHQKVNIFLIQKFNFNFHFFKKKLQKFLLENITIIYSKNSNGTSLSSNFHNAFNEILLLMFNSL